jgi:hypothetical protein
VNKRAICQECQNPVNKRAICQECQNQLIFSLSVNLWFICSSKKNKNRPLIGDEIVDGEGLNYPGCIFSGFFFKFFRNYKRFSYTGAPLSNMLWRCWAKKDVKKGFLSCINRILWQLIIANLPVFTGNCGSSLAYGFQIYLYLLGTVAVH